ncbi:diguanylate cyclase domain-containing protein [Eisenbergiella sp.]
MKKKMNISIALAAMLIVLALPLYFITFHTINKVFFTASVNQTMETMEIIRNLGIRIVDNNLRDIKTRLENAASDYSVPLLTGTKEERAIILSDLPLPADGIDYWFATPDGAAVDSKGDNLRWEEELNLEKVFADGKTAILDPYFDAEENYYFCIAAPVFDGKQVSALLVVRLDGFCISRWIGDIQFQIGEGVAYIVRNDGRNIAASREENYDWITSRYNAQDLADTNAESKTVAELEGLALKGKSGRGSYLWEGARSYLVYAPMKETDWGFYVGFYGALIENYIQDSAQKSLLSSLPMFLVIFVFFIALMAYANYNLRKEKKFVSELLLQKNEIQKQAEDLIIKEERFRVALAQTNNRIFEYDLQTGNITNFYAADITHSSDSMNDLKRKIIQNGTIDNESLSRLHRILDDTHNGILNNECVIKAVFSDQTTAWYKVSISPLSKQQTRVIGIMEDITKEKSAEFDSLTGLLNKKVMETRIRTYLQEKKKAASYAFLMIDIDNFKLVNDTYGHPTGDQVIIQTGLMLEKIFSSNALVGRFGGDEFCVFCYEVASPLQLEALIKCIDGNNILADRVKMITYSCGIIICSAENELSFEELYKKADEALYEAKQRGKNQYCFYEEPS